VIRCEANPLGSPPVRHPTLEITTSGRGGIEGNRAIPPAVQTVSRRVRMITVVQAGLNSRKATDYAGKNRGPLHEGRLCRLSGEGVHAGAVRLQTRTTSSLVFHNPAARPEPCRRTEASVSIEEFCRLSGMPAPPYMHDLTSPFWTSCPAAMSLRQMAKF
jgi:hypothetical protein